MHHWADELALTGFAKLGYPGVIYCVGVGSSVEEFVRRVKSMQWLALRVRFVEAIKEDRGSDNSDGSSMRWLEFEKVGEVVEHMHGQEGEQGPVMRGECAHGDVSAICASSRAERRETESAREGHVRNGVEAGS